MAGGMERIEHGLLTLDSGPDKPGCKETHLRGMTEREEMTEREGMTEGGKFLYYKIL